MQALGWLSAVALGACGIPLLLDTKRGDKAFLLLWLVGELAGLVYVLGLCPLPVPLLYNYGFNSGLVILVMLRRFHAP